MNAERDFVLAALAMRAGLITADGLSKALSAWTARPRGTFATFLQDHGILTSEARAALEQSLEEELGRHSGDARAALDAVTDRDAQTLILRYSTLGTADQMTVDLSCAEQEAENARGAVGSCESVVLPRTEVSSTNTDEGGLADAQQRSQFVETIAYDSSQEGGCSATAPTVDSSADSARRGRMHVRMSSIDSGAGDASNARYTRTRLHAQGGLGKVWLAMDVTLGREVALKELKPERAANARVFARFVEEAKITGRLEHPSIVPIYELDVDSETGRTYYTMRFIRGKTLAEACRAHDAALKEGKADALAFRGLLSSFVGVCHAIAYAHSRGVIHRDLKGQNIVLGDFGEVVVLDWGLAKLVDRSDEVAGDTTTEPIESDGNVQTLDGEVMGTPAYMPPEQAAGDLKAIDGRSDVYSLGAILYEILAGRPPFVGSGTVELLRRVREADIVPPRSIRPSAPPALEAIAMRAMKKVPDERYQTALELAREVSRWMADEPVDAYPDPWHVRAGRWAKRHRTLVATAAAALIVSAIGLALGNILVSRERDRALAARDVAQATVDTFFTDVGEEWLEDHSDVQQQRFLENALTFYDPSTKGDPASPTSFTTDGQESPSPPIDSTQREFLERSLAYYRNFTSENGTSPRAQWKRAMSRLRVALILRKLGQLNAATTEFAHAIEELETLKATKSDDPDVRRSLANARARYGDLLTSLGKLDESRKLLEASTEALRSLALKSDTSAPIATELARALRSAADSAKFSGDLRRAEKLLTESIRSAEKAIDLAPNDRSARFELATANDDLGFVYLVQSKSGQAEPRLRRALELLGPLVDESPTRIAFRDGLAKTSNTLALVLLHRGADLDAHDLLQRSIREYERLSGDFPSRPEFQRGLARGLVNQAIVDESLGNLDDARATDERAIEVLSRLIERKQSAFKLRRDLARVQNNLGSVLDQLADRAGALEALGRAERLNVFLVKEHPGIPEFLDSLAMCQMNQGRVLVLDSRAEQGLAKLEEALGNYERLVASHDNVPQYQDNLATCQRYLGDALVALARTKEAEAVYRKSLASVQSLLEQHSENVPFQRHLADTILSLNELFHPRDQVVLGRKALAIYERLASESRAPLGDRRSLAAARTNLGEYLAAEGAHDEARRLFLAAANDFDGLKSKDASTESQRLSYAAYVRADLGDLEVRLGGLQKAVEQYRLAIDSQQSAARVGPGSIDRGVVIGYYKKLASVLLEQGDHVAVASLASELVKNLADLSSARVTAAELLAGAIDAVDRETDRSEQERVLLTRVYRNRAVAQIRAAIDGGLKHPSKLIQNEKLRFLFDGDELRDIATEEPTIDAAKAGGE